jgi:transcriptional regulator with XRE-family HTH domain
MTKEELAQMIRQRRKILQLSQAQLSELAEVGIKTIYALEQAQANPSWEVLRTILDTLGLEMTIQLKKKPN